MALTGPVGKDNLDISFRLNNKSQIFNNSSNSAAFQNAKVNICASASSLGIVFVGSVNSELLILNIKDLESTETLEKNPPIRKVPMPSPITQLATNCDGSIIAIDVLVNGTAHIQLYSTASFLTPSIQKLREFRISADNARSIQLCWNPVINSTLAVCTTSGGLSLYSLKDTGIEFHSIDQSLQAKCCCWSPKGKQIVAGFANGKLIQFNMEMKAARMIDCPPGVFAPGGNFETIAVQWLSTYQFAIVFSNQQQEARPVFYILNATKAGPLQYIAYNDVCYSTSEMRSSKIYLQYIQQWGMILVASANCVDVSFLRISKTGDIPEWTQEYPNDQYPAELPLTVDKDESFPIGFEIDTACTGKLLQEDGNPYPVMPMLHMLSTSGVLCSFYILNTTSTYVDICSPPRPIDPRIMNQFFTVGTPPSQSTINANKDESVLKTPSNVMSGSFTHSTPSTATTVKANLFGSLQSTATFSTAAAPTQIGITQPLPVTSSNVFSGFSQSSQQQQQQQQQPLLQTPSNFQFASKPIPTTTITTVSTPITVQPLITVPPTYNPSNSNQSQSLTSNVKSVEKSAEIEDDLVYMRMIQDEMKAFELEFKFVMEKSRSLNVLIGTKEESAEMRRQLEELDELKKEATDTIDSLRCDVQANRLGLMEMFSMVNEVKTKCEQSNNKTMIMIPDRSGKRKIENLSKMIGHVEVQVQAAIQLLQSQWSNYQEAVTKDKKDRMHIPSLEGVYQTLRKQQEIIYGLRGKLKLLKSKLGICDDVNKQKNSNVNAAIESLSDSIISMSLIDQVQKERSKLSNKKLENIRNSLTGREVVIIKPQRPKLLGLNSEIVIEKRANALKNLKKKSEPTIIPVQKTEIKNVQKLETKNVQKIETKPIAPISQVSVAQKPPSESVFNIGQIQTTKSPFTSSQPVIQVSTAPQSLSFGKKPEEISKPSFSFGGNQPALGGFNLNSSSQSSPFGLSSTQLVLNASNEKKKEEQPKLIPQQQKPVQMEQKPVSTISNTPIAVTANFSVSLSPKSPAIPVAPIKDTPKVIEEKKEDPKPIPSTTESTTFTFSLNTKKDTTKQAPISFGSTSLNVSEAAKSAFSFGSSNTSSAFNFGNKTETPKTTASSIFGSSQSVTSTSSPFSGFSSNLGEANKTSPPLSSVFSSLTPATTPAKSDESKSSVSPPSIVSIASTSSVETKPASTFSFGALSSSLQPPTSTSTIKPVATTTTIATVAATTPSIFAPKNDQVIVTPLPSNPVTTDSILSGLSICSPEVSKTPVSTPTTNIFATPQTTSIFGSSTAALKSDQSVFGTPTVPAVTTQSSGAFGNIFGATVSPTTTPSNIFGSATPTVSSSSVPIQQPTSIFGSSNIFGSPTTPGSAATPASPQSQGNIFGAQTSTSIFAQVPPATTTTTNSIFGRSTFGSPATNTGSIFGSSATSTTPSSPFGSVFGTVTPTPQSASGTTPQQSSIFGGGSTFGSLTSQPAGNIFGNASSNAPTSTFGAPNIFSSGSNQAVFGGSATFSSTFGGGGGGNSGSIFGQQQTQQPTFGGGATFGSPKSNIFGSPQSAATPSNNIFEQLGSQQSGNLFGSLAQATSPVQQQPQQQQSGVFSGSAFSSWR